MARPRSETPTLAASSWRAHQALALTRPRIAPRVALGLEIAGLAAILLLAALVRADHFMLVPRLTDETLEVVLGLRLARDGGLALVGYAPHIGSLFTYVLAGTFLLLGPKVEAGRLLVMTSGVLTILPTYLLGRDLGRSLGPTARAGTAGGGLTRGRLVGLTAALLLALSGPHIVTSSRIAYSNSLTPLFAMTGLWLVQRGINRRSDLAMIGGGAAFGLAVQTHVSALTLGPGIVAALMLPRLAGALPWERGHPFPAPFQGGNIGCADIRAGSGRPGADNRGGLEARAPRAWPRWSALLTAAEASLLMVSNLVLYNLLPGPTTAATTGNRIERYVGDAPWTLDAWGGRLTALLQATALAVGGYLGEVEAASSALLSPTVVISAALALLGLWACARRGAWLPLLATTSVLLSVSLLNGRVEPIVPRVRHYATLVPLGMVMIAVGLAWLHDRLMAPRLAGPDPSRHHARAGRWGGAWAVGAGLALVPLLLGAGSLASYNTYAAERLGRPDKNNAAYLAVLDAVATSGAVDERLYLDDALMDQLTMSGGRMLSHLRYAFDVRGQEFDTIELDQERLPVGLYGVPSRRLVLAAESVEPASRRYRLVPLPGEPGEGSPLRAFRAFPLHE